MHLIQSILLVIGVLNLVPVLGRKLNVIKVIRSWIYGVLGIGFQTRVSTLVENIDDRRNGVTAKHKNRMRVPTQFHQLVSAESVTDPDHRLHHLGQHFTLLAIENILLLFCQLHLMHRGIRIMLDMRTGMTGAGAHGAMRIRTDGIGFIVDYCFVLFA